MQHEGPSIETLTRRLAEIPEDFLQPPRIGEVGTVEVPAVVGDLARLFGGTLGPDALKFFLADDARRDRNRLAVVLLLCWLFADDWFRRASLDLPTILGVLRDDAADLAGQNASKKFVTDPDRREELARLALARLDYRPAGETVAQAQDRLATLNSAERARVLQASRAAEERSRKIREALVRQAAEESADKWTRE